MIDLGNGLDDKMKLFWAAFLKSIPNTIRKKLIIADLQISKITENLYKNLTIKVNGVTYLIPDTASFYVVQPHYEKLEQKWFHPKKGDVVVDIGAHIGKYTIEAAIRVGEEGKIIAVEPLPSNFEILKKNIKINKLRNVAAFNLAAWHSNCNLTFYVGISSAQGGAMKDFGHGTLEVEGRSMDALLNRSDINKIDWIKMDVEGAEYEALLGLEETLRKFKPRLMIEVLLKNLDRAKTLLHMHGYSIQSSETYGEPSAKYVNLFCTKKRHQATNLNSPQELSFELAETNDLIHQRNMQSQTQSASRKRINA